MKRLLAMLLVLIMVFCLAACGEDETPSTTAPTTTPTQPTPPPFQTTSGTKVGFSIADLDALLQPLLNGDAGTDVENLYFEMGASEKEMFLALGAKLLGENKDAALFVGGEDIVFSAPALLEKNYGISMENLAAALKTVIEQAMGEAQVAMPNIDPQVVLNLLSKYYTLIIDEIKTSEGITATNADDAIVLTGELDSDAIATIFVDVLEAVCADEEFFELMGTMQGVTAEEFKQSFLQGKPSKDELLAQMKAMMAQLELSIKIDSLVMYVAIPMIADLTITMKQPAEDAVHTMTAEVSYDLSTMAYEITLIEDSTVILSMVSSQGSSEVLMNTPEMSVHYKTTISENGISGFMKQNGVELMSFAIAPTDNGISATIITGGETMSIVLAVSDTDITLTMTSAETVMVLNAKITDAGAEGSITVNGMELGKIVIAKKVEGSKTTYTLTTLSIQGTAIDFTAGGLSFYVDDNAQVPAKPEYTDVTTMDEAELNAVLDKFATDNADLIALFSGLFGNMGGSAEGEIIIESDVPAPGYAA